MPNHFNLIKEQFQAAADKFSLRPRGKNRIQDRRNKQNFNP